MSNEQERAKSPVEETATWEARIILGDRHGNVLPPDWVVSAYDRFRADVMHPKFPCFFGTQAERRGEMFYSFVNGADLTDLPRTMAKFSELSAAREHEKNNFALFFEPDPVPLGHDEYRKRFWHVLQYLHDHDPTITHDSELLEPDHPDWEFEFAGVQMFVVGCTPSYQRRRSRNLGPGMIMLFQPRSVFVDAITQKAIGPQARDQVRKRLLEWDGISHHPDLGVYGDPENREWKQYFLPDDDDPSAGRCPFLSRKRELEREALLSIRTLNSVTDPILTGSSDSIIDRLARYARDMPDQVAIRFLVDGESLEEVLTYRELDVQARRLAHRLRERAESGDRAVLLMPSGLNYVVSLFACFYAGMIAVPAFPPEAQHQQNLDRLRSMLSDSEPSLLLTDAEHYQDTASFAQEEILGQSVLFRVDRHADSPLLSLSGVEPEAVAFLQYTSGSTSTPKGVMVTHSNIAANEVLIGEAMQFGPRDVMVSWAPLYHDMGLIGGLFAPIYHGFPLVLMTPQAFLERPSRWLKAISKHRGTAGGGPDFAFQLCIDRVRESQLQELDLSSWRVAYCGAEPIRPETVTSFGNYFASAGFRPQALYPCYGLAEGTLMASGGQPLSGATARFFDPEALARGRAVAAASGTGIIDCGVTQRCHDIRILDPQSLLPCPDGHIGEICLAGPSIAKGYWKNRKATREIFITDPDGRVSLRTGDLGFLLEGRLFVSGRLKDLIIIRGQNSYPQDIERAIGDHVDALRKGRISAFPITAGGHEAIGIAAEVSPAKFERLGSEAILHAVRSAVSSSHGEVPGLVLLLRPGDLPRTSSGKLRRSACLPEWLSGSISPLAHYHADDRQLLGRPPYSAPISDDEKTIASVWEETLDIARIGRDDDFISLGGQSILAAQLAARLGEIFAVSVSPAIAFSAPTVVEQAEIIRLLKDRPGPVASLPRRGRFVPLTHEQEALWFQWQLEPQSVAYNVVQVLRIEGEISEQAMLESLGVLLQRHEALRARFVEIDGIPHQEFGLEPAFDWARDDVSILSSDNRLDAARSILADDIARPFDLTRDPLLRVRCVAVGDGACLVQFVTHHIVADARSAEIFLSELAVIYTAACNGERRPLPLPAFTYGDYCVSQRAHEDLGGAYERQLAYWRSYLGTGDIVATLPPDARSTAEYRGIGKTLERGLGRSASERVGELAQQWRTTPFAVMLSALLLLVGRYGGQTTVQVGVPIAGRDYPGTRELVGDFVKMLVVRGDVTGSKTIGSFIREVHQGLIVGQLNQNIPFTKLVEALRPERDASASPLFNITFNLRNHGNGTSLLLGDAIARHQTQIIRPVAFDLMIDVDEFDHGFSLSWSYRPDVFHAATIDRLSAHYGELLTQIAAAGEETRLAALTLTVPVDHGEPASYPFVPVTERIARQASLAPQAEAVVCEGERLSYGALEAWSNRIARRLQSLGVGPDERV
ncbi:MULTISPECIES: AMP-binding protein, partial [unclassified Sinorhizobium]|uniref:AMP-binding protein n=1 Tax=unclassified Sinorhizobium TaxID=2613772 RepID=UPI00352352A2